MLTDIVGQDAAVRTLQRVKTQETPPLLLIGKEGVGRRFAVLQLVLEMFCVESKLNSCDCFSCRLIREETHPDLHIIRSLEGKDIGVDQIRENLELLDSYPSVAPVKAVMVEAVDRLTTAAANALLKTLEEPPPTVRFFLLAEDASRVIPTIRSRSGMVRFNSLPEPFVISKLHQLESNPLRAMAYARMAQGSVGQAIQFWASGKLDLRDKTLRILEAGLEKDLWSMFSTLEQLESELVLTLQVLDQLVHDLLIVRTDSSRVLYQDVIEPLARLTLKFKASTLHRLSESSRQLLAKSQRVKLNLLFHVQTLFAQIFLGE